MIGVEDAVQCLKRGDPTTALGIFHALLGQPINEEEKGWTWCNIGACYEQLGRGADAHYAFRLSAAINPKGIAALSNLGASALGWHKTDEAERFLRTAISCAPPGKDGETYAHVLNGMATVAIQRSDYPLALEWVNRALASDDNCVPAHWNRSLVLLGLEQWAEGWKEHEWRKQLKRVAPRTAPVSPMPEWQGESLKGVRLAVHCEQGWGDMLMWARVGPMLQDLGATLIWEAHDVLKPLFEAQPWVETVVEAGKELPEHDLHTFVLSAVRILGLTPEKAQSFPYLKSPHRLKRLGVDRSRKTVALAWKGRPEHGGDHLRSTTDEFAQYLVDQFPGVNWVSMQKNAEPPKGAIDGRPWLTDFAWSSALLRVCDLLVSVDSGPIHLAGALDVPGVVMLPHNAEWRWRPDLALRKSRWYNSIRLTQQTAEQDWESLVPQLREHLV